LCISYIDYYASNLTNTAVLPYLYGIFVLLEDYSVYYLLFIWIYVIFFKTIAFGSFSILILIIESENS